MKFLRLFILVLSIGLFAACHSHDAHDHDHDHDEVFLQITSYTQGLELFAEAAPFTTGQPSDILAHFTCLPDFKPLEQAQITMSLIVGSHGIRQTVDKAYKPGIYRFRLTPEVAGNARLLVEVKAGDVQWNMEINNLRVFDDAHDAIHHAEARMIDDPNGIVFTKEQGWKVDFATALPQNQGAGQVIRSMGQLQNLPSDEITLVAQTNGVVMFTGLETVEGQSVRAQQALMRISGGGMAENNIGMRYAEATNNYQKAKADYDRAVLLAADKIVSEKELLQLRNEYDNARILWENLSKHFQSGSQVVSSPLTGFVKELLVSNGEYVESGTPLLKVGTTNRFMLHVDVPQRYYPLMNKISMANIRCPYSKQIFGLDELKGRIISRGQHAGPDNFMLPVHLEIENPGLWAGGSFVEVFLQTTSEAGGLFVPNTAIMESQGVFYVFVQLTPELFAIREVKTAETDGKQTRITGGLKEFERVVTRGAIWVKLAQSSGALDPHAGHVH